MMRIGEVQIDLAGRQVRGPAGEHPLTPREAEVLGYLVARPGQLVTRRELERDVWGFRAGVRSEAVPVCMRRLRAKLEADPVRGEGWRLAGVQAPRPSSRGRPYLPRPALEARVERLLEQGWGRVWIVGGPGLGKTRLAQTIAGRGEGWLALGLDEARGEADVAAVIHRALETDVSGCDAVARVLTHRGIERVVLEGVEHVVSTASRWALELETHGITVLLTSRVAPTSTEPVIEMPPLRSDEAEAFLERCLAASRFGTELDAEARQALLEAAGGVPLAIELLAAANPEGHTGALDPLADAWTRCWNRLTPSGHALLADLAQFEETFSLADLEGADPTAFEALVDGCWLTRSAGRWSILASTRQFLRAAHPVERSVARAHARRLLRRLQALGEQAKRSPAAALDGALPLVADAVRGVEQAEPQVAAGLAAALEPFLARVGRYREAIGLVDTAWQRGTHSPALAACRLRRSVGADTGACLALALQGDLAARCGAVAAAIAKGVDVDPSTVATTLAACPSGTYWQVYLRIYLAYAALREGQDPVDADLPRACSPFPVLDAMYQQLHGMACLARGDLAGALAGFDQAVARASEAASHEIAKTSKTWHLNVLGIDNPFEAFAQAKWRWNDAGATEGDVDLAKYLAQSVAMAFFADRRAEAVALSRTLLHPQSALPPSLRSMMVGFAEAAAAEAGPAEPEALCDLERVLAAEPVVQAARAGSTAALNQLAQHVPEAVSGLDPLYRAALARVGRVLQAQRGRHDHQAVP